MAHRDFDRDREHADPNEKGPSFTLCGQKFDCLPRLPARVMSKVTQAVQWDEGGSKRALPDVIEGIRGALIRRRWIATNAVMGEEDADAEAGHWVDTDDVARFDAMLNSTDDVVDTEDLGEVLEYLLEEYGKRPTRRSKH